MEQVAHDQTSAAFSPHESGAHRIAAPANERGETLGDKMINACGMPPSPRAENLVEMGRDELWICIKALEGDASPEEVVTALIRAHNLIEVGHKELTARYSELEEALPFGDFPSLHARVAARALARETGMGTAYTREMWRAFVETLDREVFSRDALERWQDGREHVPQAPESGARDVGSSPEAAQGAPNIVEIDSCVRDALKACDDAVLALDDALFDKVEAGVVEQEDLERIAEALRRARRELKTAPSFYREGAR